MYLRQHDCTVLLTVQMDLISYNASYKWGETLEDKGDVPQREVVQKGHNRTRGSNNIVGGEGRGGGGERERRRCTKWHTMNKCGEKVKRLQPARSILDDAS